MVERHGGGALKRRLAVNRELVLIGLLAIITLVPALLWLNQEMRYWSVLQVERLYRINANVDRETLAAAVERAEEISQGRIPGAHLHSYSFLAGRLASRLVADEVPDTARALELRRNAMASLAASLAREPAEAHAWASLAYLRFGFHGPSDGVVDALRLSIYLAPNKRGLLNWRLGLAARSRSHWDENFTQLVQAQIMAAWQASPRGLVATVDDYDLAPMARQTLAARKPDDLDRFENLLTSRRR